MNDSDSYSAHRKTIGDTTTNITLIPITKGVRASVVVRMLAYCTSGPFKGRCCRTYLDMIATGNPKMSLITEDFDRYEGFPMDFTVFVNKDYPTFDWVTTEVKGPADCHVTWIINADVRKD
jgi:hypothetical protein